MAYVSKSKVDKIRHPQAHYKTPDDLIADQDLSPKEKEKALNVWEQDARQLLTASNEGMPGRQMKASVRATTTDSAKWNAQGTKWATSQSARHPTEAARSDTAKGIPASGSSLDSRDSLLDKANYGAAARAYAANSAPQLTCAGLFSDLGSLSRRHRLCTGQGHLRTCLTGAYLLHGRLPVSTSPLAILS